MKFTFLGCGTSTGVPVIGCPCAVCKSNNSKNKRLRASGMITSDSGEIVIFDTSPDFRYQCLRAGIEKISGVIYTHAHADHILGLDDLRAFNFIQKTRIPIYTNKETASSLKSIFDYIFTPDPRYKGGALAQLDLIEISPLNTFTCGGINILPFSVDHGSIEVLGLRIGSFAYITDCKFIPDVSLEVLKGVKTLVLDGLRYEQHSTHFTIPEAIETGKKLGVKELYLTHLTHSVDYEKVSKDLPSGVQLAYDGLEIPIG